LQTPITVSILNEQIKSLLETTFMQVSVEGELSRITHHNSGHIYFTLKDSSSSISGVMFRGNASKLKFRLEEGLKVVITGAITLYAPRGSYQINAFNIEPAGHGALALAFEQLKKDLSDKGYFDEKIKKPMPKFAKRIALITSATGAALQDMQRVAAQRWPLAQLFVYDALVQGESAKYDIVSAIEAADAQHFDVMVVSRGGGSMEDLWAFNEEMVADAIFHAQTPVVSAVGHEIDWLISDFVADLRAPTPSAAMQMILPDQNEYLLSLDAMMTQFTQAQHQKLFNANETITHLKSAYAQHSIDQRITNALEEIGQLKIRMRQSVEFKLESAQRVLTPVREQLEQQSRVRLQQKQQQLQSVMQALQAQNPKHKSKKGYAQITQNNQLIDMNKLQDGAQFEMLSSEKKITAQVLHIEEIH